MILGDVGKAGISSHFTSPIEKRNVHHAVHNDPARAVVVPRPNEFPARIIAARKQIRGMHSPSLGTGIASNPIVCYRGMQPHKAYVVMKPFITFKSSIKPKFYTLGRCLVFILSGRMVHLP
ncbi:hypothetical protein D3C71_1483950 [compost metagenome]